MGETILVTGGSGRLGGALVRHLKRLGHIVLAPTRAEWDGSKPNGVKSAMADWRFDAVFHAAAMTQVDVCEEQPEAAMRVNAEWPAHLARECRKRGARLVHVSTDYVFDGVVEGLRSEDEPTNPLGVYGKTKLLGEQLVLAEYPEAVVARVSWIFGPDRPSFADSFLQKALDGAPLEAIADKWSCPSSALDLAEWLERLRNERSFSGLIHLCNSGLCSWWEYGKEILRLAGDLGLPLRSAEVAGVRCSDFASFKATRPKHTGLDTARFTSLTGIKPRPWQEAMKEHIERVWADGDARQPGKEMAPPRH
jgi:dTDP-4-dehydrorhamnose reductase